MKKLLILRISRLLFFILIWLFIVFFVTDPLVKSGSKASIFLYVVLIFPVAFYEDRLSRKIYNDLSVKDTKWRSVFYGSVGIGCFLSLLFADFGPNEFQYTVLYLTALPLFYCILICAYCFDYERQKKVADMEWSSSDTSQSICGRNEFTQR